MLCVHWLLYARFAGMAKGMVVEQAFQPANVEQAFQPADVEQAFQPADVEQAFQPAGVEQAFQPVDVEQAFQPADGGRLESLPYEAAIYPFPGR